MKRAHIFLPMILLGALAACDALTGSGYPGDPLATLTGRITRLDNLDVNGEGSVAVFWQPKSLGAALVNPAAYNPDDPTFYDVQCQLFQPLVDACDGTPNQYDESCRTRLLQDDILTEEVSYEVRFPLEFQIPLYDRPPAPSLYDLAEQGGHGVFTMAHIAAFVDENQNGLLDKGTPERVPELGFADSAFQDYLPAPGEPRRSYFVVFFDGELNLDAVEPIFRDPLAQMPQGFSLWYKEEFVDDQGQRISVSRSIQPIDTPIEMVTESSVVDSYAWCVEYDTRVTYLAALPPDPLPICPADGLSVYWERETKTGPCVGLNEVFSACLTDPAQAPADWPCPIP